MSKLDYFTPKTNTDNTINFVPKADSFDEIVIGASCWHVIRLPFTPEDKEYLDAIAFLELFYKQGDIIFSVFLDKDTLVWDNISYLAEINLTPEQTGLFKTNSLLESYCQIKTILKDGSVSYGEPHKLKLFTPIDLEVN